MWSPRALGNYAVAKAQIEVGLQISRDVGASKFVIHLLMELAEFATARDEVAAALGFATEGLTLVGEASKAELEARLLVLQGDAQAALGRSSEASGAYDRALAIYRELSDARIRLEPLVGLARRAAVLGHVDEALAHVGEVEAGC